jgi:hypothetical protein
MRLGSRRAGPGLAQRATSRGIFVPVGCQRGGAVVDERAGTLGAGTEQTPQGRSHESPAITHGGACAERQEVDEAQSFFPMAAAAFAEMGVEGKALGCRLGSQLGFFGGHSESGSLAWRGRGAGELSTL